MKRNKKQNIRLLTLIFILLLGMGFAALAANLKIDGTVNVSRTSWDVHFENVSITEGSVTANPAPTSDDTTTTEMTYTINFTKPGDYFEFTTDIVNEGTIDAMVDVVSNNAYANASSTTPITLPTYLTSTLTYADGVEIAQNQELLHNTSEKIKVRVEFKKDIEISDLPSSGDTSITFKFVGDYKQADENAVFVLHTCAENENITTLSTNKCTNNENVAVSDEIICKRAINLHQEECSQTNKSYYCSGAGYSQGDIITYGQCGTQGSSPVSGDAFTCDINGDGTFDELLERFYYVSDYYDTINKVFDTSTAALVYYNDVAGGVSCNKNGAVYANYIEVREVGTCNNNNGCNWYGPYTAKKQLPMVSQWKNVNLKSITRAILAEDASTHDSPTTSGGTLPTDFSYSGYAARLLTGKELMVGCDLTQVEGGRLGSMDSCNYLMENTSYSKSDITAYWLETPFASSSYIALFVSPTYRFVYRQNTSITHYGVRPVIDVPKSKISY